MRRAVSRTSVALGSVALLLVMGMPSVAQGATGTGAERARTSSTADCPPDCPPEAPTNVRASVTAPRVVTLTWNASTDPEFARYEVYRNTNRDTSRPDWMPMAGPPTRPTYRDRVPEVETTYYYYVLQVNTRGQRSPIPLPTAIRVPGPPTPTNVQASISGRTVNLSWDATLSPTFTHFEVLRDNQPDVTTSTWASLGKFGTRTTTDTPGVGRFFYYVVQHRADGNYSNKSSTVQVDILPDPDRDRDDDGAEAQGFGGTDCADDNAAIRPGRADVINGIDDDCDGIVDPTGPRDQDADGVNASPFGDDCNDGNAAVRPGVRDLVNAIDDDCDGIIDPDMDGDGFVRGSQQDCNDGDPAIRPGVVEIRGNRIDENCDGRAEPFPRIDARVQVSSLGGRTTRVVGVRALDVPARARIVVTCKGRGCPRGFTVRLAKAKRVHSLTARFRRVRLRPGAVLEVRITAANVQGRRWRFEARRNRALRTSSAFIGDGFG